MEPALDKMSLAEKLRLMEALWDDLSRRATDVASPEWHGQVLADRQARVDRGEAHFTDWDEAKRRIRDAAR